MSDEASNKPKFELNKPLLFYIGDKLYRDQAFVVVRGTLNNRPSKQDMNTFSYCFCLPWGGEDWVHEEDIIGYVYNV